MDVVITLASSGRWPSEPQAVAALKTAFYLKIKHGLRNDAPELTCTATPDHLLVTCGGYAFRVLLHHDKELATLERIARRAPLARYHGSASGSAAAEGHGTAAPVVSGFVNVGGVGITEPEPEPAIQKKRRLPANAFNSGGDASTGTTPAVAQPQPQRPRSASDGAAAMRRGLPIASPDVHSASKPVSIISSSALASTLAGSGFIPPAPGDQPLTAAAAGARLDGLYLRCVARPRHAAMVNESFRLL
jgi:hypothetical protein